MNNIKLLKKLKHYSKIEFIHEVDFVTSYLDEVIPNSVYICFDKNTVKNAINNGARTIIYEGKMAKDSPLVNYIHVDDIKKAKGILYKTFYKNVSSKIKIIGVIGTTGKSSTSRLLVDFLNYKKIKSFWIGTHKIQYINEEYETKNTTIDIHNLYKHITLAIKRKYKYLVMEISSIGVSELRVFGINFYRLIFTNFSEDHLDYHKNMTEYFYSKAILFYQSNNTIILNKDDEMFTKINKYVNCNVLTYSTKESADTVASDIYNSGSKLHFRIQNTSFKTNYYGSFFIYNLLAAITTLNSIGCKNEEIKVFLSKYMPLRGRMTTFNYGTNKIIVDYAHTPKSLEMVLTFLRKNTGNKLIAVGGCGGNREREKRKLFGDLLDKYTNYSILCDDNPRDESPISILEDIKQSYYFEILPNRKEAIKRGIDLLEDYSTLLIFGKGDEYGIDYAGKYIEHNDIEFVEEILKERKQK